MRTTTRYFITIPGTEIEIELDSGVGPSHDSDIHVVQNDDGSRRLTWKVPDDDAQDLWEWTGGEEKPENWVNGRFKDFRNQHDGGGEEARDAFYAEMVELVGEDRVFIVDVYSHGLEHFSRRQTVNYPDRRWDVAPACVLAVPPDATNPEEYADGQLSEYTDWVNGDVWGIIQVKVPADYTEGPLETEACWGYIGSENADENVKHGL